MENNPYMQFQGGAPSAPPAATAGRVSMDKLQAVLNRFEISIAEANDLVVLSDYEMVVIADDSGSMQKAAMLPSMRVLGQPVKSRWEELKETVAEVVEIASCFDESGVDVHFLNRPSVHGVKSAEAPNFRQAFSGPPAGRTPLTETLLRVARSVSKEKGVLLFIFTDGEPDGGKEPLKKAIRDVVKEGKIKIQIMACTAEESEIGWLNDLDKEMRELDVTDDYYTEKEQVLRLGLATRFTRGDWCLKAMLGPVSAKFDAWDEGAGKTKKKKKTAKEDQPTCCTIS